MEPFEQLIDVIDPTTIEKVIIDCEDTIKIKSTTLHWVPGFYENISSCGSDIIIYNSIKSSFDEGKYTVPAGESAVKHLLILAILLTDRVESSKLVEYCKLPTSKLWDWVYKTASENNAKKVISPEGEVSLLNLLTTTIGALAGNSIIDREYLKHKVNPMYIIRAILDGWKEPHKNDMLNTLEKFIQSMDTETQLSLDVLNEIKKHKNSEPSPTNRLKTYMSMMEKLGDNLRDAYLSTRE